MKRAAPPEKFEIRAVEASLGHSNYPRPCIVAKYNADSSAWVFFLSTKNYSEHGQSFCIDQTHSDFPATGLAATSFTVHPIKRVPQSLLKVIYGELTGDLAVAFRDWYE